MNLLDLAGFYGSLIELREAWEAGLPLIDGELAQVAIVLDQVGIANDYASHCEAYRQFCAHHKVNRE